MKAHTAHPATATAAGDTKHPATSRTQRGQGNPATPDKPESEALPVLECVPADESPEREDTTKDGTAVFLAPPEREDKQRPGVLAPHARVARLSIVARILPECLARNGGRWNLVFQIENPTPEMGTAANTFAVPIGEGCALSFDRAAALLFAE